jgi:DNA-binding GntR family transcriptional regulator
MDAASWIRAGEPQGRPSRRAVAEWTLEQIYELLFSEEYNPGDAISELDVAARLRVSRSPVRVAFRQLEDDGLLLNHGETGKKTVVKFGVEDIEELYSIRAELEGLAHREAAGRIGPAQLREVAELLAQMSASLSGKHEANLAADFQFHEVVCQAAGLPRLLRILRRLWLQTFALVRQLDLAGVYPDTDEVGRVYHDHAAILAALREGDATACERAVVRHLLRARDSLLSAAAQCGLRSESSIPRSNP